VPPDLAAAIKNVTGGAIPEWGSRLASVPWVVRAFLRGIDKKVAHMPVELWDLIAFVVSQDNACRYCYGATRTVLKILGYGDNSIDRLERDVHLAELPPAEAAALHFARKVSQANPLPTAADLRELARAGFAQSAIAEIAYIAAFAGYGNRVATLFALPPDQLEQILKNPLMRLMRPLLARKFRGKRQPAAKLPAPNEPPFADLIAKLEGSPTAHAARSMLDEALASPELPRRTKLLMFAVIGRALGCEYIKQQAQRALQAETLAATDVDEVLSNLGSPKLDDREKLLIPFARETVRYRSLAIQQRTRELSARLRIEELIEAVGVAALANSMARLAVLLDPC
jgi:alkylhydroperoxidase family enzyme